MKIPKRPNYNTKPYPSVEEIDQWSNFISLVISLIALVISLISYFLK